MRIVRAAHRDFLRWRGHALALSVIVVLAGAGKTAADGRLPLGIDFSGGTIVVVRFAEPVTEEAVRAALGSIPGEKVVQRYGERAEREILIRLPGVATEQGTVLEENARLVLATLEASDLGPFVMQATEIVGPVVGAELERRGIYATVGALLGITVYIALRFHVSFAAGALAALFHDLLVTLALLALFGYELSLNVVAALLTITGYSVNDTIVVFDRVRENLRVMRREPLSHVVNTSISQCLGRTIITSVTTLLAVLALYLFGGEVLRSFAFTMLVGVVAGTYSTIFIAAAIAVATSGRGTAARVREPTRNQTTSGVWP